MAKKKKVKLLSTKESKSFLKKNGVKVLGYKQGNRYLTSVALTEKAKLACMNMKIKHGITASAVINMILEDWK